MDRTRVEKSTVICANSKNTQKRIRKFWKLESELFYPSIAFDKNDLKIMPHHFQFESKKFFLNVSRPRSYKNVDTIIEAISSLDDVNLVLIGKHKLKLHPRVKSYERVSDQELCWLYANALALIAISFEDFGLTPVEAHTFGTPTIVLSQGGYLETCIDKLNSTFIDVVSAERIRSAILDFRETEWNSHDISRTSEQFSEEIFMRNLSVRILQIQKRESNE